MDGTRTTFGGNCNTRTATNANCGVQSEGPELTPHNKHFYTNGMIDIRIENVLFRVPRLGLVSYSHDFADLMRSFDEADRIAHSDKEVDARWDHLTKPLWIQDEDVTSLDFERLIEAIYPSLALKLRMNDSPFSIWRLNGPSAIFVLCPSTIWVCSQPHPPSTSYLWDASIMYSTGY